MDIVERLRTVVSIGTGTVTSLRLEAADEIERLREHCDRMASLAIDNAKDTERALKLFKINNRLRAAFNEILNHPVEESKQWEVAVHEMKRIARKELSEEDDV